MTEYVIEPALPSDGPAVGQILSDWIDQTPWMPRIHSHQDEQDFASDLIARGWVHVARQGGETVGFLARAKDDIHALYLTKSATGRGIGLALLDHAKTQIDTLTLWVFEANLGAQKFYKREGFQIAERGDGSANDEGLPDIRYEWRRG